LVWPFNLKIGEIMSAAKVIIFGLIKGLEVCGRDEESKAPKEGDAEKRAFDNLVVVNPVYDDSGNLLIAVNGINLRVREVNIAYEVDGEGDAWNNVLSDIKNRGDALIIGTLPDPAATVEDSAADGGGD